MGADPITAAATATGGAGGTGVGHTFISGIGGNAIASATANSSSSGSAIATALATGGAGGSATLGAVSNIGGSATAAATANGVTISQISNPTGSTAGIAQVGARWNSFTVPVTVTVSVGTTNQNTGSVTVTGPSALIVGITGSGSLAVGDGVNPTVLQLAAESGGSSESSLVVNAGSTLDVTNNHVIVNYGTAPDPVATIRGYLKSGYSNGTWTGPGIDSSVAALPANHLRTAVGYADGADQIVAGLSSGQIEIKYTLYGDADLDGVVSGSDFTLLVANIGKPVARWDQGDFDYDGVVSGNDFTLLVADLGRSASGADVAVPASEYAAIDAFAASNGLMADVPEPTSLAALAVGAFGLLARRRRV